MATPITYDQAATLLGVGYTTISQAVRTGRLTQLPAIGRTRYVIEEQVKLFAGKPHIQLSCLSDIERQAWEEYSQEKQAVNVRQAEEQTLLAELAKMPEPVKDKVLAALLLGGVAGFFQGTRLSPV